MAPASVTLAVSPVDAPAEAVSPDPPQAVNEIAIAAVKSAAVNFLLIILSSSFYD